MKRMSFLSSIVAYALVAFSKTIDFVVGTALSLVQNIADIAPEKFAAEIQSVRNWVMPKISGEASEGFGVSSSHARNHVSMLNCIGQRSCYAA